MTVDWSPLCEAALARLKDFQLRTVAHAFDRLYAPDGSGRFLIADEVGLGKTLIAQGIIARAIPRLLAEGKRVDVVYLCSSTELARENLRKLSIGSSDGDTFDTRLTMLPLEHDRLKGESRVNFIAFTPGTSLELRDGLGQARERVLLYWMVRTVCGLPDNVGYKRIFAGNVEFDRFEGFVADFEQSRRSISPTSLQFFKNHLRAKRPDIGEELKVLEAKMPSSKKSLADEVRTRRNALVGRLRECLAESCVELLEPDLIILDEFQRFSNVLDDASETTDANDANALAHRLLNYPEAKLLLLSATPYRMYTTADEAGGEDHYRDFLRTVTFLEGSTADEASLERSLRDYRTTLQLAASGLGTGKLLATKEVLQQRLHRVMVRNERLASTADRNGMLKTRELKCDLDAKDLVSFVGLQKAVDHLEGGNALEYWRSSPYPLNFLDENYKLKARLHEVVADGSKRTEFARLVAKRPEALLPWDSLQNYSLDDLGNARLRHLARELLEEQHAHELLWIPPSLPHYGLRGPFHDPSSGGPRRLTKRLVFSAWRVAPRGLAALLSHEVERRLRKKGRGLKNRGNPGNLPFNKQKGRLTGMPVLALLYPSLVLATRFDPLRVARELAATDKDRPGFLDIPVERIVKQIAEELETVTFRRLPAGTGDGPPDERWYWAAPLFLDRRLNPEATTAWFAQEDLASIWQRRPQDVGPDATDNAPSAEGDEQTADADALERPNKHWEEHVEVARAWSQWLEGPPPGIDTTPLGPRPADLAEVMAELAVAGPAVVAYRAMLNVASTDSDRAKEAASSLELRTAAARIAWALRGLFIQPDAAAVVAKVESERDGASPDHPYWRHVLGYCVSGGLQAVLDEYLHVLVSRPGPGKAPLSSRIADTADEFMAAIELRTAQVGVDKLNLAESGRTITRESETLRAHFALRYGDDKSADDDGTTRATLVRKAFNSPFWPFVLATTSVGQEGLDFHAYCHTVVHWNLPTNPVDLEQREGRVHRYKSHAIRLNVAAAYGSAIIEEPVLPGTWVDHWSRLFDHAVANRPNDATDIIPYWIFPGPASIERHVYELPFGREAPQLKSLRSSLTLYRMVFGQARQDDLMAHLVSTLSAEQLTEVREAAMIDLGTGQ